MQSGIRDDVDIDALWKSARQTRQLERIARILGQMTGLRERCMYCGDSRSTDIEHFRPKKSFRALVFSWPNMLWICTGCNRCKGDRFPCDSLGVPLIIDPTVEDPWDFLVYDLETGEITARWEVETGEENAKGLGTLNLISTLRHQAVTEGRKIARRNLVRVVDNFLRSTPVGVEEAVPELLSGILDNDDYGLVSWCFLREGQEDSPFRDLREEHPSSWTRVVEHLRRVGDSEAVDEV